MMRHWRLAATLVPGILLSPTLCSSQADVVPLERRIEWAPGIPGDIPDYPIGVSVVDYGAVGDGVTDDSLAFTLAIAACADHHAVLIPAGTYLVTQRLEILKPIVLRGEGDDATFLKLWGDPAVAYSRAQIWIGRKNVGIDTAVVGGCAKGSNELEVASVAGFAVGDLVELRQDNDESVMARPIVPPEENDSWAEGHWGWRAVGQYLLVTALRSA